MRFTLHKGALGTMGGQAAMQNIGWVCCVGKGGMSDSYR